MVGMSSLIITTISSGLLQRITGTFSSSAIESAFFEEFKGVSDSGLTPKFNNSVAHSPYTTNSMHMMKNDIGSDTMPRIANPLPLCVPFAAAI